MSSPEKIPSWMLHEWQQKPLEWKIERSLLRIKQYYEELNGKVFVSFSGGKDSTVLLDLVRRIYPEIIGVHVNTGLEYPEIEDFVKNTKNAVILHPKMAFNQVLEKYGYPVISKEVSMAIDRYRVTKDPDMKIFRMTGVRHGIYKGTMGVIPKKYQYLVDAPFKISDKCCDIMKKQPLNKYEKETGTHPITGVMASDSARRKRRFLETGCNSFGGHTMSTPMAFWTEKDVWDYIHKYDIRYSKIYDMGERRTGCIFCMFGCQREESPNRFERMKVIHPKLWEYCMYKLKLQEVLDYTKVNTGIEVK